MKAAFILPFDSLHLFLEHKTNVGFRKLCRLNAVRYCMSSLLKKKIKRNVNPFVSAQMSGKSSGSKAIMSVRVLNYPKTNKELPQGNYS